MRTEWLLPPAQRTLVRMLERQANLFGDRACVTLPGAQWSHAGMAAVAGRRGAALRAAGVQRGDRVAVMCGNRSEFLETVLGCGWIGAVAVPVNSASMGPQIEYLLTDSGARLLVIEDDFLERLDTADLGRTALRDVWGVDGSCRVWSGASAAAVAKSPRRDSYCQHPSPVPLQNRSPTMILSVRLLVPMRRALLCTLGAGVALLAAGVLAQPAAEAAGKDAVTVDVARADLAAGRAVLIDIREPHEHATGIAPGARLLPSSQLSSRWTEIPRDRQPVYLVCATQNRSRSAIRALRERGPYENVRYVTGGMTEWSRRGLPVVKP